MSSSAPSPARGLGLAALVLAGALLLPATVASAHSAFLGSTPEPGQRLARSPGAVTLTFTEPLQRRLSWAHVRAVAGGREMNVVARGSEAKQLVVEPRRPLPRGAYRVDWHTVSTEDGHALEGSFSFGVRAAAVGGEHSVQQSPLARDGFVRIGLRAGFYILVLLFAGALLLRTLLPDRSGHWLVPEPAAAALGASGAARLRARERGLGVDVGLFAGAVGAALVMTEAADAAGGLSLQGAVDYLLGSTAGVARALTVLLVLAAAILARRRPRAAAGIAALALGAVTVSGHADSASPRPPALLADWVHLVAGAVWLGGIGLIAAVWGPLARDPEARRAAVRYVLPRFGSVALPAFVVVVLTGTVNAIIELGHLGALWSSAYGRVLLVKVSLVAAIGGASYLHALRIRPRLLRTNPHPDPDLERRHWRLLRSEPLLGVGVLAAAALLAAFPLPPRQLKDADEAQAAPPACNPCPLPRPAPDELAVADQGASNVVAAWIRRRPGLLTGEVRLIDIEGKPSRAPFSILGARQSTCGAGCQRFTVTGDPKRLDIALRERGRRYVTSLPARWERTASERARRVLDRAERTMRGLRGVRQLETVTSGPGSFARVVYDLRAPDRLVYRTSGGETSVVVGPRQWTRVKTGPWMRGAYPGGPFRTRSWFRWSPYAVAIRLLGVTRQRGRRVAELALMDPGTPAWLRLRVDLGSWRVLDDRLVTKGHFWVQRYTRFDQRLSIRPPRPLRGP